MSDHRLREESVPPKGRGDGSARGAEEVSAKPSGPLPSPHAAALPLFPDTQPEAQVVLLGLLRQAPPWRKLHMVGQLNETVRALVLSGLRERHPEASPEELHRRRADILLGTELARRAYGPVLGQEESRAP